MEKNKEVFEDLPSKQLLDEFLLREGINEAEFGEALDFVDKKGDMYNHSPVKIREFIESPEFLDAGDGIWPVVMEELEEINSGKYIELLLTGSIGSAKALDVDTPIPTPKGWTKMGDLVDGDEVYSETGEVCLVTKAWPVMHDRPCYEVKFSDHTSIVADEDHLWLTETRSDRANRSTNKKYYGRVKKTSEILDTVHKVHGIVHNESVFGKDDTGPYGIDPYTLGAWLGDGSKDTGRIWSADKEILDELRKYYHLTEQYQKTEGYGPGGKLRPHTIHGITRTLRKYDLICNKHIPEVFMRGSYETRLSLLQGLMDTDGTVDKRQGRASFTNVNERIIDGLVELVRSLGMQCRKKAFIAKLYEREFPAFMVTWSPIGIPVFRLPRKAKYLTQAITRASNQRYKIIKEVIPVESRPVRCITVDSPSKLYLAGDGFTPTHNTHIAIYTICYQIYLMSCMDEPHKAFGQDRSAELMIIFQNINEPLAKIPYKRFRSIIQRSPYFKNHFPYNKDLESEMQFPNNIIVKPVGGSMTAVLGQNVIGGLLDECVRWTIRRSILTPSGTKVLSEMSIGDTVYGWDGNNIVEDEVVFIKNNGFKNILEIKYDNKVLQITENHPIATPRGWVKAGKLKEGDTIYVTFNSGWYITEVDDICQLSDKVEVGNLQTRHTNTYIADGVIVHNCNFMEIVEKSKKEAEGKKFDQAEELYSTIVMRRKSRFMDSRRKGNALPGIFCMASSKRYPGQFTDRKQKEAETDPTIYVYDKRIWEVKPRGTFGEARFQVYIGDPSHLPRIIKSPEEIEPFMDGLIDEIPLEFKSDFEKNIFKALKDIGGRSTRVNNPFMIDLETLRACFGVVDNIASRESCDFKDTTVILHPERIQNFEQYRFAHIDLAITGDSAGLAIGHVPGFARVARSDSEESELLPVIQFDLLLEISPPVNGEVNFAKIRDLLHKLREQIGLKIKWLSMDSFQSRDTLQIMAAKGMTTGLQSIDRTPEPMDFLKSAFMDNRVNAPAHAKALQEAEFLQVNETNGKVDHPPGGSSDIIQAMAGVVYGISRQALIWAEHDIGLEEMVQFGARYGKSYKEE